MQRSSMGVRIDSSLDGIDWVQAKADLAEDDFDNGRSPEAPQRSFEQSQHVAFAREGDRVVGMARLLSDGVCNAYLVDAWTASAYRRRGVATSLTRPPARRRARSARRPPDRRRATVLCLARLPRAAGVLVDRCRRVARQRREPLTATPGGRPTPATTAILARVNPVVIDPPKEAPAGARAIRASESSRGDASRRRCRPAPDLFGCCGRHLFSYAGGMVKLLYAI
jgi:hypothetical protein